MTSNSLYSKKDIEILREKIDDLTEQAEKIKNEVFEPDTDEFSKVMEIIRKYIIKKKRIVYGGTAYNEILKNKDKSLGIYKEDNRKDIEFYSHTPLEDLKEICDILYENKFKYIQGSQAFHESTYTIFVNFQGYCDISYIPKNIYQNMPVLEINNMIFSHPLWILVDILRQFNDPLNSFWRLKDKTFERSMKLLSNFDLNLYNKNNYKIEKHSDLSVSLFNRIKDIKTLIFLGSLTTSFYINRDKELDLSLIEVITDNFTKDFKKIYKIINELFSGIDMIAFNPFFQFRDKYVEFKKNGKSILRLFRNNEVCNPYNTLFLEKDSIKIKKLSTNYSIKEKDFKENFDLIKIGTFDLNLNFLLIKRHHAYINRRDSYKKFENIMDELLKEKRKYLEKHNKTVLDDSPYRGFNISCYGKTTNPIYSFRLKLRKKEVIMFKYDPSLKNKDYYELPKINFPNISGNESKSILEKLLKEIEK